MQFGTTPSETADELRASLLAACTQANAAYAARMVQRELFLDAVIAGDLEVADKAEAEMHRLAADERNFDVAEASFEARLRGMGENLPSIPPETFARYFNSSETTPRQR